MSNFFHCHVHSEYSVLDALSKVEPLVAKAKRFGQPAVSLTDHGNMSGTVQLYLAGKKHGIPVFPGFEGYLVQDTQDKDAKRYHVGLLALNYNGYKGLVRLTSESHKRENFHKFPRFDFTHLSLLSEDYKDDVAILTGCYFGLVQQALMEDEAKAKRMIEMYAGMFTHTFVELQDHGINHGDGHYDSDIVDWLYSTAMQVGVPVLASQDSHYLDQNDRTAHNLMKRSVYGNGESGDDSEFPGDSFHLTTTHWVRGHYEPSVWSEVEIGHKHLLDLNNVSLPALDTFKSHAPVVKGPKADSTLRRIVTRALNGGGYSKRYYTQADHELDTIKHLGIADYILLWWDIVQWCKSKDIFIEARGSANGSVVCYLTGITQVDPIKNGLLFERFLSKDRIKPPDIDMDVEASQRMRLVQYIQRKYTTVQIGTYSKLGKNIDPDTGEERGSVLVTYLTGLKKRDPEKFDRKYKGRINSIEDVSKVVSKADGSALRRLAKQTARKSYGVHAAGILMEGDEQPISDYVPTMLVASSDTTVTQYTMDDVEKLGYMKLDVLGVNYLGVLRRAQELIGRTDPTDFSWIPDNDPAACAIARSGRARTGIFQFDGYSMAKGGKAMKVRSTTDFTVANALYRPAVTDNGLDKVYIARRNSAAERAKVTYPHPAFEKNLKDTHGIVLYQEQVIEIMRDLGMSIEAINVFFAMVKDSGVGSASRNEQRIAEVKTEFANICASNGIADWHAAWEYVEGYAAYGFNKGHSAGYGMRGYRGAYLKAHYPLEFMSALMEVTAGSTKEMDYIKECRIMGIRILPPDVNVSGASYTMDSRRKAIRRGLSSIKGIGDSTALTIEDERVTNGEYSDLTDFCARSNVSGSKPYLKDGRTWIGVLATLRSAGALGTLGVERE